MSVHVMRLSMGIVFLLLGIAIFTRQWLFPGLDARFNSLRLNLGGALALVFSGLNFARWYTAKAFLDASRTPVRPGLRPDPTAAPQAVPDPELDFTRPAAEPRAKHDYDRNGDA
jgi:hypothetical protein